MRHPFLRTLAGAVTPATTDPNFENVTLLLHGDGTNGGQNNTFVDGSTNNFTITRNGNTTQGTFSPYGNNWSNYFDGNGDYVTAPGNSAYNFGTGDWTVEAWFYLTGNASANDGGSRDAAILGQGTSSASNITLVILGNASTTGTAIQVFKNQNTLVNISKTVTIPQNTWHHVAATKASGTIRVYLNGTQQGTSDSDSTIWGSSVNAVDVGRLPIAGYLDHFPGYISNLRVLKGTALYTANFTPPTAPLTAITNTSLLTCQSNRFRDASTNNFTITRNGDVSVQRFSPFSPTAAYSAGTIGGGGYFDGNGDWLEIASNAALQPSSSDFGMEFWLYLESLPASSVVRPLSKSAGTYPTGFEYSFYVSSTGQLNFQAYTTSLISLTSATSTIVAKCWYHIAIARSGNNYGLFANGSRVANQTVSGTIQSTSSAVAIGRILETGATQYITGYVCDVRIVKGSSVYDPTQTTLTVPTAPLTAITNTQLLCNFQNAAILDNAMMAVPETVGNAQIDTTTKKYGTGSLEFDGTGDWLLIPDSPDQRLGTGNFTIECWLYLSATGTARGIVGKGTSTTGWLLSTNTSNAVVFTYGTSTITSTGTLSGTTWYHIAVVREGTGTNQTKIYIGGTNDGTGTVSTDFTQTNAAYVGANRTGGDPMNGYIDDLRITRGVARYTANFTAPTAAFPDL